MGKWTLHKLATSLLVRKKISGVILSTIFLALFFTAFSVDQYRLSLKDEDDTSSQPQSIVVTDSIREPEETVPTECKTVGVLPKEISFPSLKKNGCMQLVGVDREGNIAVPTNVHVAGWYINSVKPGDKGLSIIVGHRDGITKPGIFRDIDKLQVGDAFTLEFGDKKKRTFEVLDVAVLSIKDTYDKMYERQDGVEQQLNLVSCIGTFDKKQRTYDKRVVVVAKRVK